jgi:hypothetical protein
MYSSFIFISTSLLSPSSHINNVEFNAESDLFVMSRDVGVYVFIEPDFADNSHFVVTVQPKCRCNIDPQSLRDCYARGGMTNGSKLSLFQVLLTLRLIMSYIYGAPILDVSRSHTTTHHSR